jgi:F-type H+-transporting ATPase subunit delta
MKNLRVAHRYAVALMSAAESVNALEGVATDCELIAGTIRSSRELRLLLASPLVQAAKKTAVLHALFETKVSRLTLRFLDLITAKSREGHLTGIIDQFASLRDVRLGIVSVDVTSAVEFTPAQESGMVSALERYTRKKVRVRVTLDKAIKGGLVVRIGDTVLDASIRRQLEILRERFRAGGPQSN